MGRALRHHHNDMRLLADPGLLDRGQDLIKFQRQFGNMDQLGAAGITRHQGEVAAMPTHGLDDENAPVTAGRVTQAVDCLQDGIQRRIHADGGIGAHDVVIDARGNPHHRKAPIVQRRSACQRTVPPDHHQPTDAVAGQHVQCPLLHLRLLEFGQARAAQESPPLLNLAAHFTRTERDQVIVHQTEITALDTHDLDPEMQRIAHNGADRGIHARRIAAAGHDGNPLNRRNSRTQSHGGTPGMVEAIDRSLLGKLARQEYARGLSTGQRRRL